MPPTMHPSVLTVDVRSDPKRSAEVKVFDRLQSDPTLNENWSVFYSYDWIENVDGMTRDGEADFVVAHPDVGILVLEVKGGRVTIRPGKKWTSVDRKGNTFEIENPIQQAMKSKKAILKSLLENWGYDRRIPFIRMRHAAILPDTIGPTEEEQLFPQGLRRSQLVFKEEMDDLGLCIRRMINWNASGADDPIGMGGVKGAELLEALFGAREILLDGFNRRMKYAEGEIAEFSEQQKQFLDITQNQKRCVIHGCAGTGKTLLAVEKVRREIRSGKNVLLLCFNQMLRLHLRDVLAANDHKNSTQNPKIETFHRFAMQITGLSPNDDKASFFDRTLPEAFHFRVLAAAEQGLPEGLRFDTIVVDEGQDFKPDWLEAIQDLAELQDAALFVFEDANQNIYNGREASSVLNVEPLTLINNYRNTDLIFEALSTYLTDTDVISAGPSGPSVRWLKCDASNLKRALETEIRLLQESDGVDSGEIVVLTGASREASSLPVSIAGVDHFSGWEFKGLERNIVFVAELENIIKDRKLAYATLSRAKFLLVVVGPENQLEKLTTFCA